MTEYERVRGQIQDIILCNGKPDDYGSYLERATKILSLNGIEIRADDQSLPDLICRNAQTELVIKAYDLAQQEMKEAGFIKVAPKGIK